MSGESSGGECVEMSKESISLLANVTFFICKVKNVQFSCLKKGKRNVVSLFKISLHCFLWTGTIQPPVFANVCLNLR